MCVHGTLHEALARSLARSLALSLVRRTVILACWIEWSGIAMHATNDDNCHEPHRNRNEPAGCRASSVLASWNEIKPKNQLHTRESERATVSIRLGEVDARCCVASTYSAPRISAA